MLCKHIMEIFITPAACLAIADSFYSYQQYHNSIKFKKLGSAVVV